MSTVIPMRLLTAEEFALLPSPEDGSQQELVNGVVVTMPPPSTYHGLCCNEIVFRLNVHVRQQKLGHVVINDSGVILGRDPATVRGPDVAFWSRERMPEPPRKGYAEIVPDLVVQVLRPGESFTQIQRRVQQYLRAGTREVWLPAPEEKCLVVSGPSGDQVILSNGDTLTGGEVLPGFSCAVADLFP